MDEIQFIVHKLNEDPFNRSLSLVDFDELSNVALLQLLTDVCAKMNPDMAADVRDLNSEEQVNKMYQFLQLLKFKVPRDEAQCEDFTNGLGNGEKAVIYPILHWVLQRCSSVCAAESRAPPLRIACALVQIEHTPHPVAQAQTNHKRPKQTANDSSPPQAAGTEEARLRRQVPRANRRTRRVHAGALLSPHTPILCVIS
jgi:hypothetical protein